MLIFVALPGVDAEQVETVIEGSTLVVSGRRILPVQLSNAVIHRFERRLRLPPGHYAAARRSTANGCLVISLQKVA